MNIDLWDLVMQKMNYVTTTSLCSSNSLINELCQQQDFWGRKTLNYSRPETNYRELLLNSNSDDLE